MAAVGSIANQLDMLEQDEGRAGTPGAVVRPRPIDRQAIGETQGGRIRVSRSEPQQTAVEHGDGNGATADEGRMCHSSWLPFQLPGLGGQRLKLLARNRRNRPRARHRRQGRASLPWVRAVFPARRCGGKPNQSPTSRLRALKQSIAFLR
jgi:hypothetical protein